MKRLTLHIFSFPGLLSALGCLLVSACTIRNDIPYPIVEGAIEAIEVEGQCDADGNATDEWMVYSVGGGTISEGPGSLIGEGPDIYALHTIKDIMQWCRETGRSIWEYVDECEDSSIWDYLMEVWEAMKACVERGLDNEGVLPGPLHLSRKAATYYIKVSGYKQNRKQGPRRERGKRLRRHRGHRAYLRFLRGASGRALPYRQGPQFLRQAHTACAGDGWHLRQRGQAQRLHLGCRGGVPG